MNKINTIVKKAHGDEAKWNEPVVDGNKDNVRLHKVVFSRVLHT